MNRTFLHRLLLLLGVSCGAVMADDQTVEIPKIKQPGYLESYIDPVFGSKVTRITGEVGSDIPNTGGKWNEIARHHYSKDAAWNCDQSLLFLGRHHGSPSGLFLDGYSYKVLFARNGSPGKEIRWHEKKPDIMVYVKENMIGYWNVRTESTEVIATFPGYLDFHIGPWEGNLSNDGNIIVINARKGKNQIAFAYNFKKKHKYPDLPINDIRADWVSVSASGKYMVINGKFSGKKGDQTQVYDLEGNKIGDLWRAYGRPSHYDLAIDGNGDDVAVGVSKSEPDSGRIIKRRLRDGKVTVLTTGGFGSHTSARNAGRPGWAYVSYQGRGPTWPPYWDEVIAVKLDGSMIVERIAHLHSKRVDYLTEAHAVPSPDGKRVLWASAWGRESGRPIAAYVAEKKVEGRR